MAARGHVDDGRPVVAAPRAVAVAAALAHVRERRRAPVLLVTRIFCGVMRVWANVMPTVEVRMGEETIVHVYLLLETIKPQIDTYTIIVGFTYSSVNQQRMAGQLII